MKTLFFLTIIGVCLCFTPIEVVQWVEGEQFSDYLASRTSPVIVRGAIPSSWKSTKLWDFDYLSSHATNDPVGGFYKNSNRVMGPFYDSLRPMHGLPNIQRPNPYETDAKLEKSDINKVLNGSDINNAFYWSYNGGIDDLNPQLMEDIDPIEEFIRLFPARSSINIWMGMKDVITPCHYDGYHNMGEKLFRLFPPIASHYFYMHPYLHPSFGQCQANLRDGDLDLFDEVKRGLDLEIRAHLHPEDMLYIPPFWIHEVTSLTSSLSINFWTDISESTIMSDIMEIPLPNDPLSILSCFPHEVVADLFRYRYEPMMVSGVFNYYAFPSQQVCLACSSQAKSYVSLAFDKFDLMNPTISFIWKQNLVEYIMATSVRLDYVASYLKNVVETHCL